MSRAVDHDSIRAFNSVVRIRGADDPPPRQVTAEQWTRIRALIDSLHSVHGVRLDSINNGADDDGSGSVLALEIAEFFAAATPRPRRSLLFVWHTAEEKGLYGAQYFSDHPTVSRDSIVAQINMDQMGRGDPVDNPPGGANSLVVIGARRLSTELGDLAERVNQQPQHVFFAWTMPSTRMAIQRMRIVGATTTCTRATAFRSCFSARPRGTSTTTW
jgi:Zn-dependent M28 family amino/carboxypeptidase